MYLELSARVSTYLSRWRPRTCGRLPSFSTHHGPVLSLLAERFSHLELSSNPYERTLHGRGESYHPACAPELVAYPRNVSEVQDLVRFCVEHRIPMIPFGAGTSVEGHLAALEGGLSMDMKHFNSMKLPEDPSQDDPIAVVGAGVTRKTLNQALRHSGWQFTVDPGADATLGGMVATGASGTTTVLYGGMRENLLALDFVMPNEEATWVHAGTRALKNSAGYDLVSLLCGSEGTLGLITQVTVKLHPVPEHVAAIVCAFDTLTAATQAILSLQCLSSTFRIARCELLDAASVAAFVQYQQQPSSPPQQQQLRPPGRVDMLIQPTLFLELQGSSAAHLLEQIDGTRRLCVDEHGAIKFQESVNEEDRQALWAARHGLYYAALASRSGSSGALVTDACVPRSQFGRLMEETVRDVKESGVTGPCFGHAGDGNLHCILPMGEGDSPEYWDRVFQVSERLIERTLALGGTCTGEHGVGYGKIKYLERQYGPGAVMAMKTIKKAFDPYNLMNPGKVVPP